MSVVTYAVTGSRSSFMNAGQELSEIAETARHLVQRLRADYTRRKRQADPWGDIGEAVVRPFCDDFGYLMKDETAMAETELVLATPG